MHDWRAVTVLSIGGALGVNTRHWLGLAIGRSTSPRFPWGTVAINASGSFAIGFLVVVLARRWPDSLTRLGFITGFLGGYTTFSTFTFESFTLWERGDRALATANVVGSVVAGLVAVALGVALGRSLVDTGDGAPEVRSNLPKAKVDDLAADPLGWKSPPPSP